MIGKTAAAIILAGGLAVAGALPVQAQENSAQSDAASGDAAPAGHHAVVNGHHVQPRPADATSKQGDAEAARLLRANPDDGPIVQPHDLYGRPLGGNPGLDPPDPDAKTPPGGTDR